MHRRPGERRDLHGSTANRLHCSQIKKTENACWRYYSHPSFGIRSEDAAATGAKLEAVGLHITRYAIVLDLVNPALA
jgi:hypothetical protein